MRTSVPLLQAAAIIGLAAATPVAQQLDLGAILTAPVATITGPDASAINQTSIINTAAQIQSITAHVTTIATASVTGASASVAASVTPSATGAQKRSFQKRSLTLAQLLALWGISYPGVSSSSSFSSSSTASATSTSKIAIAAAYVAASSTSSSTSSTSTSSYFTSLALTSTTSTVLVQGSSTSTTSSTTACPTTPEAGTYCGFINPEDPCSPQPAGSGPQVTPDTTDAFMAYAPFHSMAANAATPSGYVNTFSNLNASTSATSYLGLYTISSYSPSTCASYCDNNPLCTSFNLYIERDPSQNPSKNDSTADTVWGYWCPQPSSITNYKCTLWGSDLDSTTATNTGEWREDFNIVIVGSNGYDKTNATVPVAVTTYDPPKNCSGAAINGGNYYLGSKFFSGAFNPQLCGAYATAQTSTNKAAAIAKGASSYTPCNMFNAYHVHKNGVPLGTYCALYDTPLSTSWATNKGSYSGKDYYGCRNSWTYALSKQDNGKC